MTELRALAERVVARTLALGADEVSVSASAGTHVTLVRRGGKVEQATEATTRAVVVSLLSEGRYSSNATADLRPEALDSFLRRCVASCGYLEPDRDYALPPIALCGRGSTAEALDQCDPSWADRTAADRLGQVEALEEAMAAESAEDDVVSISTQVSDACANTARVLSTGFAEEHRGAWFLVAADVALRHGEHRPEASASFAARYLSDLPGPIDVARETMTRARQRLGSAAAPSGAYPMIVANRTAPQLLGVMGGPLSGSALHLGRSCLADRLGTRIASELLTIRDDPTLPRGLGSRPWDGDALAARPRIVVENGVLRAYNINVYYGRKLGMEPTSGSRSNWVIQAGDRPWQERAAAWPQAILVTSFLGGNSNPSTGDFSFGIRGMLVEHGEITRPLSEMNVSGNLFDTFGRLVALGDDPWPWSSIRSPTLLFEDVAFSGS